MAYAPTDVEKAVYKWLREFLPSNVTVIYANQMSPRPAQPFATLMGIDDAGVQVKDEQYLTDVKVGQDYKAAHHVEREATFSIQLFGENSFQLATQLAQRLKRRDVINFNAANMLSHRRSTLVRRVSAQTSTEIESRSQFDVTFGYRFVEEYTYEGLEQIDPQLMIED